MSIDKEQKNVAKRYLGIILGVCIFIAVGFFMPTPSGMSAQGQRVLAIMLFALSIWIFDSFPIGIGSCFAMALIPLTGVMSFDATLRQFMRPATFFVIATYAISCALACTPLSKRVLRAMIRIVGKKTSAILLAVFATTALLSSFMSNVPVTAMMMSVAMKILDGMNAQPGKSRMGRALMIGIPFAAMCGGITTPAGSSVNVIAIDLMKTTTGQAITFLEWMQYGVPLGFILLPLSWFLIVRFFKPEPIPDDVIDSLLTSDHISSRLEPREVKGVIVIAVTIALWILGSWIEILDMTLVATISMIIFFLPGMNVFTWREFSESISWDAVFTVGSVMALGTAVVETGLSTWLVDAVFAGALGWSPIAMFLIVALVVNFIHLILPTAPSIVTMLLPPMLTVALATGYSPSAFTFVIATMAGCVMLLPIDTLTVLTYSKKYYTIAELFKVGIVNSCVWAVCIALWSLFVSSA